ncbi:MAG: DUF2262 domain-containing protein [Oscillospiraceae bacterium]|nr:DUF2262 domain-containing protein [Oscillospiraceae bacterium]
MNLNDFRRGDTRYTDYVADYALHGQKLTLDVSFEEKVGKGENTLADALPAINSKLAFIEEHYAAVTQAAVDDAHLDELAEDWLSELLENEDDETVTLEDGKVVPVKVTQESFLASLFPVALGLEFNESTDCCAAYLELCCDPDYFDGHRVHIEVNEENEISCDGI